MDSTTDTFEHGETQPGDIDPTSLRTEAVSDQARYEPRGILGKGGMGEVQLCLDRRTGREVAYKSGLPGRSHAARFAREALLQARLEHPSFVPVYDVGTNDDGTLYFTMRQIRGGTLRTVLREGEAARAPSNRLLGAFVQLCLAIDYAHSRGVVHRDLKPDNVIFGDFGEVYVLDWGIAKLVRESEDERRSVLDMQQATSELGDVADSGPGTAEGSVLGTIGYMAPEQLRGQLDVDHRADVYALGAILFEIVAGVPLHQNATLVTRIANDTVRSPAARAPGRDIPPELDAICLRATEADREARWPSARTLANAVERYLEGDRDATLRRRAAESHVSRAKELLAAGSRASAGREASRALAFAPDHDDARRILLDVIARPPDEIPEEAKLAAEASRRESAATLDRWYANGLVVVCLCFTAFLVMSGIREHSLFIAMLVLGFGSAAVFAYASRTSRNAATLQTIGFVLIGATNVCLARWVSPWFIVPVAMLVNTITLSFYSTRRDRMIRTLLGLAVIVLPTVIDSIGVVTPSFTVQADALIVHARLAEFPAVLPWLLTGIVAFVVAVATYWLGRLLDRLGELELRAHAQAWMLRHVVQS